MNLMIRYRIRTYYTDKDTGLRHTKLRISFFFSCSDIIARDIERREHARLGGRKMQRKSCGVGRESRLDYRSHILLFTPTHTHTHTKV